MNITYTYKAGTGWRLAKMIPDVRSLRIQKDVWFEPCHFGYTFCVWHIMRRYMYYMLHVQITSNPIMYGTDILYIHPTFTTVPHDSDSPPVSCRYALVLSHWGMPSEGMLQCLWQQEVVEGLGFVCWKMSKINIARETQHGPSKRSLEDCTHICA